ncbi:Tad domain-containing protein [Brevibacillus sp. 179-C 1.1 NHS]|uniref:Tad domain-containing protein n=1 Tax=Brevibacillus sp. 179-C 1.1 NHS TaxID=3235177 RepID=UPI0039A1B947
MRRLSVILGNERGNVTVFTLSVFFVMLLILFTALFNFSTVFVVKEQASNSAQQAALAAIKPIYDEMEDAIEEYDKSPNRLKNSILLGPIVDQTEDAIRASHPDWAKSEVRYEAIDQVFSSWLPANIELLGYVQSGLAKANAKVNGVVIRILEANHATLAGSKVVFTSDDRIEVQTSVRFRSTTFDFDFMPEIKHEEEVYQTGQSRQIGFLDAVPGWSLPPIILL